MWYADDLIPLNLDDVAAAAKEIEYCNNIFLHWTADRYDRCYEHYHLNITDDGSLYCCGDLDFNEKRSHTWKRNTGSIGITMCCAYGAIANNGYDAEFPNGYEPTQEQINAMSLCVATILKNAPVSIPISSVLTHKEIACRDGYGVPYGSWVDGVFQGDSDLRWDLWYLPDDAYNNEMRSGGDVIRGKAIWYSNYI